MERIYVKPREGLKVRFENPQHGFVPADGCPVPKTTYYHRRLKCGDLVRVDPAPKAGRKLKKDS